MKQRGRISRRGWNCLWVNLMADHGEAYLVDVDLSAEETITLFLMTKNRFDLPESRYRGAAYQVVAAKEYFGVEVFDVSAQLGDAGKATLLFRSREDAMLWKFRRK